MNEEELYERARELVALHNGLGKDALRGYWFERAVEGKYQELLEENADD